MTRSLKMLNLKSLIMFKYLSIVSILLQKQNCCYGFSGKAIIGTKPPTLDTFRRGKDVITTLWSSSDTIGGSSTVEDAKEEDKQQGITTVEKTINVIVNGQKYVIAVDNNDEKKKDITISDLISYFNYNEKLLVLEYNKLVCSKPDWSSITIQDNDQIELITIVGGG